MDFCLPDANTALPSVCVYACSAVHSALEVGLLKAKMIGCLLKLAMSFRMASLNTPGWAAAPKINEKIIKLHNFAKCSSVNSKIPNILRGYKIQKAQFC